MIKVELHIKGVKEQPRLKLVAVPNVGDFISVEVDKVGWQVVVKRVTYVADPVNMEGHDEVVIDAERASPEDFEQIQPH